MATASRSGTQANSTRVLTGFLGAGKTMLVNRILAGEHGFELPYW
jgi:tRNA A37 threonylcarbamoyladenosine biosynthesis protein TsaE